MFNERFVSTLDAVRREMLRSDTLNLGKTGPEFLEQLRNTGSAAYQTLLPDTLTEYLSNKQAEVGERGVRFTFQLPEDLSLFWEMLYQDDPIGKVRPDQFWGMRFPIGRHYIGIETYDEIKLQEGMLSAIHEDLDLSLEETKGIADLVQKLRPRFSSSFQHLDAAIHAKAPTPQTLADLFHDEDFRYGVVHFACHCISKDNALGASLQMTNRNKQIDFLLEDMLRFRKLGFRNRPFVFLNACQTADANAMHSRLGFPTAVLYFGAAGVVATACAVPDKFASAFATQFYRLLLKRPVPPTAANIATVLLETRKHFLEKYNNPMGFAYGLYAGADLRFLV